MSRFCINYILLLPDDLILLIINNLNRQHRLYELNTTAYNFRDCINCLFNWHKSEEGSDFWHTVSMFEEYDYEKL